MGTNRAVIRAEIIKVKWKCTHNATKDITPVGIIMTHSKINQDSCFILLNGVTKSRFRDSTHWKNNDLLMKLPDTRKLIWVDEL